MTGRRRLWRVIACGLVFASGCSAPRADRGFDRVAAAAGERLGAAPAWPTSASARASIDARIAELLAAPIDAETAVAIALVNNRSLRAEYARLGIAEAERIEAGQLENPGFRAGAGFPDRPPSITALDFGVTLNVLRLLTMPARKDIANARLDAEVFSVADAVLETATRTRLEFLDLQAAEHMAAVTREIAVAAEASYEFAARVHGAGNLSDLALANEQALYEQARLEYARARAEAADRREHMNPQLGLWGEQTGWTIVDRLADLPEAEPDLADLETLAVRQRLDLASAALEVQAIAKAAGLQRDWRFLLTTEVGFNASRDTDGQWVLGPEVSLELPIFNQRQPEILRLDAVMLAAEARLEGLAIETRSEVRRLRDRLYAARFEAGHYRDTLVPLREQITILTQQQYNFMLVDTFDLLAAKGEEYAAYRDYLSSVRDYWAIRAQLERAVGGRLPAVETEPLPTIEPTRQPEPMPMPAHEHGDHCMLTRRHFLSTGVAAGAGAALVRRARGAEVPPIVRPKLDGPRPVRGDGPFTPVITPDGTTMPFRVSGGVKEYHIVAEPVEREFADGMVVKCWGYNGQTPGPTIEVVQGDRVRLFVTNRLGEHTSIHWHGLFIPCGMDGVTGLTQPGIKPGETWVYEFTIPEQHGTFMYHPHADEMTQMAFGMMGFFIVHPREAPSRPIDRDFAIMLHSWAVHPGTYRPDPSVMVDFNMWSFNSRVFPGTEHLVVRTGDRVRVRFGNLSMWNHPIHVHGHAWRVVATDGGPIAEAGQWPETTVLVPVGSTRDVEFIADNPGDWALHCHMSHHTMNAMAHEIINTTGVNQAGIEHKIRSMLPGYMAMGEHGMAEMQGMAEHMPGPKNTLPMMMGVGQFGEIEMGGMFTVLKVRDDITGYEDPGWYRFPEGSVARRVEGGDASPAGGHDHGGH